MKPALIAFTASLAAAALAAWALQGKPLATAPTGAGPAPPSRAKETRKWTTADLDKLVTEAGAGDPADHLTFNPLAPRLAEWSTAEIRRALDDFLASPDGATEASDGTYMAGLLTAEWMRRDLDAALKWFESIPSQILRGDLSTYVSQYWPPERSEEALAYAVQHPEFFSGYGGVSSWRIVVPALDSAATQGTEEFIKCLTLARQSGLTIMSEGVSMPPDFDFAALARSSEVAGMAARDGRYFFAEAWLKQDRETAFAAIAALAEANEGNPASNLFSLHEAPPPEEETRARTALYLDWLEAREPEERRTLLEQAVKTFTLRPQALQSLAAGLEDPADREFVHERAVRSVRDLGIKETMQHLSSYRDPADRLNLLESFEPLPPSQFPRGKMRPEQEAAFRATLSEWGADAQRSDTIVARLQGILN